MQRPANRARSRARHRRLVLAVLGTLGIVAAASCGNEDLIFPGEILPTGTPTPVGTPTCLVSGDACSLSSDCCSAQCITVDGVDFFCQ